MDIRKQDANEKLYSPSQWCNGRSKPKDVIEEFITTTLNESQKVKIEYSCKANCKYGSGPRQVLDIFEPIESHCLDRASTFVYLHGGYWQEAKVNKENSCYCVVPLLKAGIRVIIADYDLTPDISLEMIVHEIEELVQYLEEKSKAENWGSLWVGGHSAGAHLAALMLHFKVRVYIRGLVLISGVYDLRPLITTSMNTTLNLTDDEAANLSPMLQIPQQTIDNFYGPVVMAVGEHESPAFHQQQIDFSLVLKKIGLNVKTEVVAQVDHFTIVERLCNPAYSLTQVIIETILEKNFPSTPCSKNHHSERAKD